MSVGKYAFTDRNSIKIFHLFDTLVIDYGTKMHPYCSPDFGAIASIHSMECSEITQTPLIAQPHYINESDHSLVQKVKGRQFECVSSIPFF